ncbi:MAG: hypothetical protein HW394_1737 [Acidobacteria bacterium]|nr:hypothetical protein [Acidobacteriota bacterium]
MDPAFLPLTGFLVGLLIGLTGMGGGALMTPFLILVLGTRPVVAVGTDLVYGAITKIAGGWVHWRQGTVDLRLTARLALGSVPAGLVAVVALRLMPASGIDADAAVRRALGGLLVVVAVLMLARLCGVLPAGIPDRWRSRLQGRGTVVAGAIVGALVGFTSVGSGSLLVPYLVAVFPRSAAKVVGTDVFHAAILVTATAVGHAHGGAVDWPLAATLLIGSVPGVALGSWMAPRAPARALRVGLAGVLLLSGLTLI